MVNKGASVSQPIVEVCDVVFAYPDGTPALGGVTFRAEAGESVALVGSNGAGKSTQLLHMNGDLTPAAGCVSIGGQPVTRATVAVARRRVGMVFQDPDDQLFMPTVLEDVAFGPLNAGLLPEEAGRVAAQALARVGMGHLAGRPPYKLSAGEKRAVAIATVLSMAPEVLVMDEPSSNLDPRARRRLIELLRSFEHARIIATHDLELVVEVCPRVIVMDGGKIVADGPTHQVLSDAALMLAHGLECPHILRHLHPH